MAIYFSEKFKQHRKAKDLTQEQLAEIFHVSPQAISRWEIGATCPDIELLPSIASYFGITVDELLGVDKIKDKERIEAIEKEIDDKLINGYRDEVLEIARKAVREFPHEYKLQLRLARALNMKVESDKEKEKNNLLESITILERILENSTDDEIRNQALWTLPRNYKKAGNKDKAVETARKLSPAMGSSTVALAQIYEGNELHEYLKNNIAHFILMLAGPTGAIFQLANSMYDSGSPERIKLINKAIGIFDSIYENGDYGCNNFFLSVIYNELAKNYYDANDMDSALNSLEKAAQHVIDCDMLTDFKQHTSLAVQGLGKTMVFLNDKRCNYCYEMLHRDDLAHWYLAKGHFQLLKDDERFKAVVAKLEEHAKSY
ncbi:MAG: helix-turn-helix domain-containing protein [Oscillospiraceae bacterium]|nr:helix-turn-helix domain-containing protein [Oscillospiraceae bacterium]